MSSAAAAAEPAATAIPEGDTEAAVSDAAIERTLDVIDLVLEHHIDPPTRPEMLRKLARGMHWRVNSEVPREIGRHARDCTNRAQTRQFLGQARAGLAPLIAAFNHNDAPLKTRADNALDQGRSANLRPFNPDGTRRRVSFQNLLHEEVSMIAPDEIRFIDSRELKVQAQIQANRYIGIGVLMTTLGDDFTVTGVNPNGPAARAGLVEGDVIDSIDGQSTRGMEYGQMVDRIRGPEGTIVKIMVRKEGSAVARPLSITRGVVPRDTVHGWDYKNDRHVFRLDPTSPIAYVRFSDIGGSTVHELQQVERQLANDVKAIVLDLRVTRGTAHHDGLLLADALLDEGTIGRVRTRTRVQDYVADRECLFRGWPLAVLVNANTSNTAEWLAAALQDNHRAVIVGQATRGDAYVYTSFPLADEKDALQLATGILERPSGKPLVRPLTGSVAEQRQKKSPTAWGVEPDHVLQTTPEFVDVPGHRFISRLAAGQNEPGVKKACELLHAKLDAPRKLNPVRSSTDRVPEK